MSVAASKIAARPKNQSSETFGADGLPALRWQGRGKMDEQLIGGAGGSGMPMGGAGNISREAVLEARVKELEAALRKISELEYKYAAINGAAYHAHKIASAALAGEKE